MHIALATCENLPDWEVDDRPLHDALRARGVTVHHPAWSDPAVNWATFDACLIRTTWDYQERLDDFLAWIDRVSAQTRLINDPKTVCWNARKWYLRDLAARGVPIAPTAWLEEGSSVNLPELMRERGWVRGFIKPVIGATARETMRFYSTDESQLRDAQAHIDRLLPDESLMLQPYLARVETEGERSLIYIDGTLSHCVRKVPVPGDYRVQDDFGAHDEPLEPDDAMRHIASQVLAHLPDHLAYGRIDLLRLDDGAYVVSEVELIEPSMFFRHDARAAGRLADAVIARCRSTGDVSAAPGGR
jgi:hypothetical protein